MRRLRKAISFLLHPRRAYVTVTPRLVYRWAPRLASRLRQRWAILKNPQAHVSFGRDCSLGPGFSLHMPHGGSFVVGDSVDFRRGFRAEISGGRVTIGNHCVFSYYSLIQCTTSMDIGDRAMFGQSSILVDGNHRLKEVSRVIWNAGFEFRPLKIANDVTALTKVTIINDIGTKSVVAANSVVNKPVPPYSIVGGVPAKLIDYFGPPELMPPEWRERQAGDSAAAPRPRRLEVTGHSLAHGAGVSSFERRFTTKLADAIGADETNHSIPGAIASWDETRSNPGDGGYAHVLQRLVRPADLDALPEPGLVGLTVYGLNDLAALGPDHLVTFEHALRSIISRHRSSAVFEESDPTVRFDGRWRLDDGERSDRSGLGVAIAVEAGASLTIEVSERFPGGTIALGFVVGGRPTSPLAIEVGGTELFTADLSCATDPYGHRTGAVLRVPHLPEGNLTIRCRVLGPEPHAVFDYWQIEPVGAPPVLVPLAYVPRATDTYANWAHRPDEAGVRALNQVIEGVVGEFGEGVSTVPLQPCMEADDSFSWEGFYPSDSGHAAIARACEGALQRVASPTGA